MQRLVTSKRMTTIALIAGAAALGVFGSSPAGATPVRPGPAAPAAAKAAASVNGRVVSDIPLRIRANHTTDSAALGSYAPGTVIHLKCKVNGQNVDGNPRWYKLSDRTGWVAARYVVNLGVVPWC